MEDVFILLPEKAKPETMAQTLASNLKDASVNTYDTWDLCIQIKSKDMFWDIVRLEQDNGNWTSLSEEDNQFLRSQGVNDLLCLSYGMSGKETALEIIRIILKRHGGYAAYDEDFDSDNLYPLTRLSEFKL